MEAPIASTPDLPPLLASTLFSSGGVDLAGSSFGADEVEGTSAAGFESFPPWSFFEVSTGFGSLFVLAGVTGGGDVLVSGSVGGVVLAFTEAAAKVGLPAGCVASTPAPRAVVSSSSIDVEVSVRYKATGEASAASA